jgi:hypothetical protein
MAVNCISVHGTRWKIEPGTDAALYSKETILRIATTRLQERNSNHPVADNVGE